MEELLALIGSQAMKYAVRSGIATTAGFAVSQCSRLLRSVRKDDEFEELRLLQKTFERKIKVCSEDTTLAAFH